jgi:cytochrome oxidase Cu insertion factor (SCO1/SenC/PrrC family)
MATPKIPPTEGPPADTNAMRTDRRGPSLYLIACLAVAVLCAGLFAALAVRYRDTHDSIDDLRATGIPASVSTPLADLMQLSPVPNIPAPNFTLIDQDGRTFSLNSFRGHTVVLQFMDPHCTDICPIVSQEYVDAYHDLGRSASKAVFIAVNVNPYVRETASLAVFSRAHQLNTISSWHFFTGPLASLQAVWHDYAIYVKAPNPSADVIHTSIVYFIDPQGRERFLATPMDNHTASGASYLPAGPLTAWGQGIALVVRQLSP